MRAGPTAGGTRGLAWLVMSRLWSRYTHIRQGESQGFIAHEQISTIASIALADMTGHFCMQTCMHGEDIQNLVELNDGRG